MNEELDDLLGEVCTVDGISSTGILVRWGDSNVYAIASLWREGAIQIIRLFTSDNVTGIIGNSIETSRAADGGWVTYP